MTRDELLAALVVERWGKTVPQWRQPYGIPTDWQEVINRRAIAAEVADESEVDDEKDT